MKRIIATLACILSLSFVGLSNNEDVVKQAINKIAKELDEKFPGKSKIKVAILHFRTSNNELKPFNNYIQDELSSFFKGTRLEVIDQNAINRISDSYGWNLDMSNEFKNYSELSEQIFRGLGIVPGAFIYGQINDNSETITITGYIIPNGLKSTNLYSAQIIESSEVTDRLLSKPIRKPQQKAEPKVVVIEKPVYIEKEIVVEKPVYIEKEVVVEKPVYIERPPVQPSEPMGKFTGKVGDKEFELLEIKVFGDRVEATLTVVNPMGDDRIGSMEARFFDPEGNEYTCNYANNTFRDRDLIEGAVIRGTLTFKGDNINRIQGITVIEFNVYSQTSPNDQQGSFRFRNVPISK
jgi:hypothetical protein